MATPHGQRISASTLHSITARGPCCPGYQCHSITESGPPRNTLESAPLAHGAARASPAVRRVALAAAGLEAPHDVGPGPLAGGWRALALLHHHAGLVVGDGHVAVDGDQVVRSPAIAAARLVHLEREGRGARVLAALDLGARRRQSGVAEAVLRAVLHVKVHLLWTVLGYLERHGSSHKRKAQHCRLHFGRV